MKGLLLRLEQADRDLAVGSIIFKMKLKDIYYAKVNGEVALRPRVCIGPETDGHVTFLERVEKRDGQEQPSEKRSLAPQRMRELEEGSARKTRVTMHKTMHKRRSL